MRHIFQLAGLLLALMPSLKAYCTVSGQPGVVNLASHVLEIQDDAAYKAGRDAWVPAGVKADSQLFAWLAWSSFPTGQGCEVTFTGVRNDYCGPRVDIQFEQRTAYNVGIAASDMPGASTSYPYRCSVELMFHAMDRNERFLNPRYDPNDPTTGPQYLPDPGFDFFILVSLNVTGEHYVNPGGVGTVPIGVNRDGCPQAQPGDEFPAYMLEGPGCAGNGNVRTNSVSVSSISGSAMNWQTMTALASTTRVGTAVQSVAKGTPSAAANERQTAASIRAASKAKLSAMLTKVAAQTTRQNGRPVFKVTAQR